jgi:hypothetical protein
MRRFGWPLLALLAILVGAALVFRSPAPYQNRGPAGYWAAAQYFRLGPGTLGRGLNVLVSAPPRDAAWDALARRVRAGATVLVVLSADSTTHLAPGARLVPAAGAAPRGWPDPATAGRIDRWPLLPGATCLSGGTAVPVIGTEACALLSLKPAGRGAYWLVADPTFFANAGLALRGHVQVLANLLREAGGGRFAAWPTVPPAPPGASVSNTLLAVLGPGLLLILWALGARFGPVRRSPEEKAPPEPAQALGHLLRRHQAGRTALWAIIGRTGPAPLELKSRLEAGNVGGREAARWYRILSEERGGERDDG